MTKETIIENLKAHLVTRIIEQEKCQHAEYELREIVGNTIYSAVCLRCCALFPRPRMANFNH